MVLKATFKKMVKDLKKAKGKIHNKTSNWQERGKK